MGIFAPDIVIPVTKTSLKHVLERLDAASQLSFVFLAHASQYLVDGIPNRGELSLTGVSATAMKDIAKLQDSASTDQMGPNST